MVVEPPGGDAGRAEVLCQCAPSPKHTAIRLPPTGLAERSQRRSSVPQALAAQQRLKHALAVARPPRSNGQRFELI
jgi:hypothetical protein